MIKIPLLRIHHVTDTATLLTVFKIRKKVFVEEQKVPEKDEYDEYENIARHFLASFLDKPCGTARWRFTEKGVKLERFAVLKEYRRKGVGHGLVQEMLKDIKKHPDYLDQQIYLNAQTSAIPLYLKSGFKTVGERFFECEIEHFQMVLEKKSEDK